MNSIPAIGAPGSLIRKFQEQPELGVELLKASKDVIENLGYSAGWSTKKLYELIKKVEGDDRDRN